MLKLRSQCIGQIRVDVCCSEILHVRHDRCAGPFAIREHLTVRVASDVVVHGSQLKFSGDPLLALALMEIVGVFVLGSVVINMPLALTQWNNWSFFFTFNAERGGGSGFWVLFSNLIPPQVNEIRLIVLGSGVVAAWRACCCGSATRCSAHNTRCGSFSA